MPFAALALRLLSPAIAGTHLDRFDVRAGDVQAASVVDVPLFACDDGDHHYVKVQVSETREAMFRLRWSDARVTISPSLAEELDLRVSSHNRKLFNLKGKDNRWRPGGEIKRAKLPTMRLATVELTDVSVVVDDIGGFQSDDHPDEIPVDGAIGLAALPEELAWAVLPSQGILRVGPASGGGAMVQDLGGTSMAFLRQESVRLRSKVRSHKEVTVAPSVPFIVKADVGGREVLARIEGDVGACTVSPAVVPPEAPRRPDSGWTVAWLSASVGGAPPRWSWYRIDHAYTAPLSNPYTYQASLCGEALAGLDIALDPAGQVLAVRATDQDGRQPAPGAVLDRLRVAATPETRPAGEGDENGEKDAEPNLDALRTLAAAQQEAGAALDAMASWRAILSVEERDCEAWIGLGRAALDADQTEVARDAFERASSHHHAWWDRPLEERKELSKQLSKLKDADRRAAPAAEQPATCHEADGWLAVALLRAGDHDALRALYETRLDLDPRLALAAGMDALLRDRPQEAIGPLRQAVEREPIGSPNSAARLALAVANARAGNAAAAEALFRRAAEFDGSGPATVQVWMETLLELRGPVAATAAAQEYAEARPDALAAQLSWLRIAQLSGDTPAQDQAARAFEQALQRHNKAPPSATTLALTARYYLYTGRLGESEQPLLRAQALEPASPLVWAVAAERALALGDVAAAQEYRARAARLGITNAGYALAGR